VANLKRNQFSDVLDHVTVEWRNVKKMNHKARFYQKERDLVAQGPSQILSQQSKTSFYWAVDTNDRTIAFHVPEDLQKAYGQQAVHPVKPISISISPLTHLLPR